jgi:hypothetical protein
MHRFWNILTLGLLVVAGSLFGPAGSVRAAESPFAGAWKVVVLPPNTEIALLLVEIKEKEGKPEIELLSIGLPNLPSPKIENFTIDQEKTLRFDVTSKALSFRVVGRFPQDAAKGDKLLGFLEIGGDREFARLERTDQKKLNPKEMPEPRAKWNALVTILRIQDPVRKAFRLKEFQESNSDPILSYFADAQLLEALAAGDSTGKELKTLAEKIIGRASEYGPEMRIQAINVVAQPFLKSAKHGDLALEFAQQAEKALSADASPGQQVIVLKTLRAALKKAGKEEDKSLTLRLATQEERLDQDFLKTAVPFETKPFGRREGNSERVVLVELFTGAQCPPCVAADVAFDALLKTFKSSEVVFLQYHLHIPGPDPLTNKDSESRSEFYSIQGTPALFIDGKEGPPVGGPKGAAEEYYPDLVKKLTLQLESAAQAKLKLTASRQADVIAIEANVTDSAKIGDDIRLHLVLVEEMARFRGSNGQRLHHQVVRAFPGGVLGKAITEKATRVEVRVDRKELAKSLNKYLNDWQPQGAGAPGKKPTFFPEDDRPLNLQHLKVLAFLQDNKTKEVLQAAQVDVGESN